ncbi:hypothetical protein Tco_0077190 [Tanacetum coccineum]
MESEDVCERYITPCFVEGLDAFDGMTDLEYEKNLISNEFVVKLEEDDMEPCVIFGRSFLKLTKANVEFGSGILTIWPETITFDSDDDKLDALLASTNANELPLIDISNFPPFLLSCSDVVAFACVILSLLLDTLAGALELQKQLDEREEVAAKVDQAHDIDWSDPAVLRYHTLQNRPFSVAEVRKNMCLYLKNQVQQDDVIAEQAVKESSRTTRGRRKKSLARKRARETLSKESAKKQKLEDDTEKEEL